jgi:hypothetical protein
VTGLGGDAVTGMGGDGTATATICELLVPLLDPNISGDACCQAKMSSARDIWKNEMHRLSQYFLEIVQYFWTGLSALERSMRLDRPAAAASGWAEDLHVLL